MSQQYIKPKNAFSIPIQTVTFVPSTNFDKKISDQEFKRRTIEVKKWLSDTFGGFTSVQGVGGYLLKGKIVEEKVNMVTAFATRESFDKNREKWYAQCRKWKKKFSQDSIGILVENDLFYI
jgi:hypothetical protein